MPRNSLERDDPSVLLEDLLANEQAYAVSVKVAILRVLRQVGILTPIINGNFRSVKSVEHIVEMIKILLFQPTGSVLHLEIDLLFVRIIPHNDLDTALESVIYGILNKRGCALNESGLI